MDDLAVLRQEFSECFEEEERQDLPRWLVEGFWMCVDWLPSHTDHPMGESPYIPGTVVGDLQTH